MPVHTPGPRGPFDVHPARLRLRLRRRRRHHQPRRRLPWRLLGGLAAVALAVTVVVATTRAPAAGAVPAAGAAPSAGAAPAAPSAGAARAAGAAPGGAAGGDPVAATGGSGDGGAVVYVPPVAAPVVDGFRLPDGPYRAGNRGLEYDTRPGEPVGAAADGTVTFAGAVAGNLHVTVRHGDGVRTSYSFLADVAVVRGQQVRRDQPVGHAGEVLHFGARVGGVYVDPAALFGVGGTVALLPFEVPPGAEPDDDQRALAGLGPDGGWRLSVGLPSLPDLELSGSADLTGGLADVAGWVRDRAALAAWYRDRLDPLSAVTGTVLTLGERLLRPGPCDGGDPPVRPVAGDDRVAVTVGGLGTSSTSSSIDDLRTADLGYDDERVVRFSYAGGRTPPAGTVSAGTGTGVDTTDAGTGADATDAGTGFGTGAGTNATDATDAGTSGGPAGLGAIAARPYAPGDTQGDLRVAGVRLADLIDDVLAAEPDATVDLFAHSQGGVVARLALAELGRRGTDLDRLGTVATLGSPHGGADLATAVRAAATGPVGRLGLGVAEAVIDTGLDPDAEAVRQLAQTSDLIAGLRREGVPDGVDLVSVAARGDVVVASPATEVDGAVNVTVPVVGRHAHGELVRSDAATAELARALAGRPPGCESAGDVLADVAVGNGIATVETLAGYGGLLVGP